MYCDLSEAVILEDRLPLLLADESLAVDGSPITDHQGLLLGGGGQVEVEVLHTQLGQEKIPLEDEQLLGAQLREEQPPTDDEGGDLRHPEDLPPLVE